MNNKIIAANFKSNKTREETKKYLDKLDSYLNDNVLHNDSDIYVFPAQSSLLNNSYTNINLGAQNCYYALNGAFSGEITLRHLEEFNISSILIGHSERRNIFFEDDVICSKKFHFFKEKNFKIFYCIGENIKTRESGDAIYFLKKQLEVIDLNYENLIIAYEPLWAIGTGVNATIKQIDEVISLLKPICPMPIIYGGSVNENNAKDILSISNGILVGNSSLDFDKFVSMI